MNRTSPSPGHGWGTETPYLAGRREWNERYGEYIVRARNWRRAAFAALAVSGVLSVGSVWQATQSKIVPYIVEVDKLGDAVAVGRADRAASIDTRIVKAQLAAWIVAVRSVSPDVVAEKAALARAYALVAGDATRFLNDAFKAHSPFGQGRSVAVSVEAVLPVSDHTYQVQWSEEARDSQGRALGTTHWIASVSIAFDPPSDERGVLSNPLGLYVTSLSWTQRL